MSNEHSIEEVVKIPNLSNYSCPICGDRLTINEAQSAMVMGECPRCNSFITKLDDENIFNELPFVCNATYLRDADRIEY